MPWPVSLLPGCPVRDGCRPRIFIIAAHSLLWYPAGKGLTARPAAALRERDGGPAVAVPRKSVRNFVLVRGAVVRLAVSLSGCAVKLRFLRDHPAVGQVHRLDGVLNLARAVAGVV